MSRLRRTIVAGNADGALLSARKLRRIVADRCLWRDLDLTIGAGERWAIRGDSGSGKTTLLRALAGLDPDVGGELRFGDTAFADCWPPAWRAQVAYVAQRPLLPEGTVEAALRAPFELRVRRGRAFPLAAARRLMTQVALGESILGSECGQLSGGEAQRVALVRALLTEPAILLLDEPTASLDAASRSRVEALVAEWLAAAPGRASVWASHDEAQLARVSDHALMLGAAA